MTAPDDGLEALLAEHGIARLDIGRNLGQYRTEYECFGCDAKLISDGHRGITPQDAEFAHLAAVVRAAGWRRGREEWAVKHHGYGNAAHYEPCADEEGARRRAALSAWSGYVEPTPARRYVTDWEEEA